MCRRRRWSPRKPDEELHRHRLASSRPALRDFKVLVVDDEKDSRVLMAHYLEEFGCEVITASDGEAGIERCTGPHAGPDHVGPHDAGNVGLGCSEATQGRSGSAAQIPVVVVSIGRWRGQRAPVGCCRSRHQALRARGPPAGALAQPRAETGSAACSSWTTRTICRSMLSHVAQACGPRGDTRRVTGKQALDAIRTEAPDIVHPRSDDAGDGRNGVLGEAASEDPHHAWAPRHRAQREGAHQGGREVRGSATWPPPSSGRTMKMSMLSSGPCSARTSRWSKPEQAVEARE